MDLFALRAEFNKAGVMVCFNGPFSHSIIEEIGKAVRNHLAAEDMGKAQVGDVFVIYIELAQNVKNYAQLRNLGGESANSAIVAVAKNGDEYELTSGNIVLKEDVSTLKASVDRLNGLDRKEIKRLFKEQLRRETPENALGAGLGLMEIALRSSRKPTYSVVEIDDDLSFFSLSAFVKAG